MKVIEERDAGILGGTWQKVERDGQEELVRRAEPVIRKCLARLQKQGFAARREVSTIEYLREERHVEENGWFTIYWPSFLTTDAKTNLRIWFRLEETHGLLGKDPLEFSRAVIEDASPRAVVREFGRSYLKREKIEAQTELFLLDKVQNPRLLGWKCLARHKVESERMVFWEGIEGVINAGFSGTRIDISKFTAHQRLDELRRWDFGIDLGTGLVYLKRK